MSQEKGNPLSTKEKFANPIDLLNLDLKSIDNIKEDCLFVVDTNVLLLPYTTNIKSLAAIREVFKRLTDDKRFFIPKHVVREFLDNRPSKLSNIVKNLQDKCSANFKPEGGSYPFLNDMATYMESGRLEKEISKLITNYRKEIQATIDEVKSWTWNDPVTKVYQELFPGNILDEPDLNNEKIIEELESRSKLKLPPGYKDGAKGDNSAGDLIIWLEILALAEKTQRHIIFISGDEKADWWHQSASKKLYPRIELVNEFHTRSAGKSFHIIDLSLLLEMFKIGSETIEDVKASEQVHRVELSDFDRNGLAGETMQLCNDLRFEIQLYRRKCDYVNLSNRTPAKLEIERILNPLSDEEKLDKINQLTEEFMGKYKSRWMLLAVTLKGRLESFLGDVNVYNRSATDRDYYHPEDPKSIHRIINDLIFLVSKVL